MGIPVLILGASGAGKSTSLRNFTADEISVFNVACKPLPFKGKLPMKNGATYTDIEQTLAKPTKNAYAIDDSQYLSVFDNMARAKEVGYGKFVDMAINEYNLVQTVIRSTPPDLIVYFMRHIDIDDSGRIKAKTIGKMLDQNLGGLEGLFLLFFSAVQTGRRIGLKRRAMVTQAVSLRLECLKTSALITI